MASESKTIVFLPRMYDETLHLLAEAYHYFGQEGAVQGRLMGERAHLMYLSEMSRVTLRLSCIMAWLLARRAVSEGGMSKAIADAEHKLGCRETCTQQHIEAESLLPEAMTELLDKSFELYMRISRLDEASAPQLPIPLQAAAH